MSRDEPIDRALPGKTVLEATKVKLGDQKDIIGAHQGNSHGDVLLIDFADGTQLVVWAFDQPDNQQIVLWRPNTEQIIEDLRSQDCKDFTERVWNGLAKRLPHMYGPGGSQHKPPFKIHHNKWPEAAFDEEHNG